MVYIPPTRYDFLGQAWTLWTPGTRQGLNILRGTRTIAHEMVSLCLIRRGEIPILPSYGMAPELFEPLSNYAPEYLVYNLEKEIWRWVAGIAQLQVKISDYTPSGNAINIHITFLPKTEPDVHLLTFPFYQYQGAVWDGDVQEFLDSVYLDDQPFRQLSL